jgi:hypothetical protein
VEEGVVPGDADEPGREGAEAAEGSEEPAVVFEEGLEDFLGDVFGGGGGGASERGGRGADEERPDVAGEAVPGVGVAVGEPPYDVALARGVHYDTTLEPGAGRRARRSPKPMQLPGARAIVLGAVVRRGGRVVDCGGLLRRREFSTARAFS